MTLSSQEIQELARELADRLYIQISGWHLYLGDAGLAEPLAIECAARLELGAGVCARQALEAVQVPIGGAPPSCPWPGSSPPASCRISKSCWRNGPTESALASQRRCRAKTLVAPVCAG